MHGHYNRCSGCRAAPKRHQPIGVDELLGCINPDQYCLCMRRRRQPPILRQHLDLIYPIHKPKHQQHAAVGPHLHQRPSIQYIWMLLPFVQEVCVPQDTRCLGVDAVLSHLKMKHSKRDESASRQHPQDDVSVFEDRDRDGAGAAGTAGKALGPGSCSNVAAVTATPTLVGNTSNMMWPYACRPHRSTPTKRTHPCMHVSPRETSLSWVAAASPAPQKAGGAVVSPALVVS